jgi:hypothetical protein
MKIIVGLDETGTETQLCDGWCYFGLVEDNFLAFNAEADALKAKYGIPGFHAKNYRSSQKAAYIEFLALIDKYVNNSPISICSTFLYRKDWSITLHTFAEHVFDGATARSGVNNPDATKVAKKFLPPLFSLTRIGRNLSNTDVFEVHFDSDNIKQQIDDHVLSFTPEIGLTLRKGFTIVANKYRDKNFPNSPTIIDTDIQVMDDEKSNIIQAADVIGNFSNNYIFKLLGSASPNRIEKAEIFHSVFGKYLGGITFTGVVKMNGENDLELLGDAAALPFVLGRC